MFPSLSRLFVLRALRLFIQVAMRPLQVYYSNLTYRGLEHVNRMVVVFHFNRSSVNWISPRVLGPHL